MGSYFPPLLHFVCHFLRVELFACPPLLEKGCTKTMQVVQFPFLAIPGRCIKGREVDEEQVKKKKMGNFSISLFYPDLPRPLSLILSLGPSSPPFFFSSSSLLSTPFQSS